MNSKYCLKRHESGQIAIWFILVLVAALVVVIYAFFPQIPQAAIASVLPAPIATETVTVAPSETTVPSVTSTATLVPTETPTQTATAIPTQTETATPTATITPTPGPTRDWEKEDFIMVYRIFPENIPYENYPIQYNYNKIGNILYIETHDQKVKAEIEPLSRNERQVEWMGSTITQSVVCYRINNANYCSAVGTVLQIFLVDENVDPKMPEIWKVASLAWFDPDQFSFVTTMRPGTNRGPNPRIFLSVVVQKEKMTLFWTPEYRLSESNFCSAVQKLDNYDQRWSYSEADSIVHDVKLEGCPSFESMEPMP